MSELNREEVIESEKWENKERSITLTNEQWSTLETYLLLTTKHRKEELEAWKKLSEEKDENEKPKYPNAKANEKFWVGMINTMDEIKNKIGRTGGNKND